MRCILDTNILVSALIQTSYPHRIVYDLLVGGCFQQCVSEKLMREYHAVLHRPKFFRYPDFSAKTESLLAFVADKALFFTPTVTINLIRDPSDNMMLELAEECKADFIVTGNTNDFVFDVYKETRIVSAKDFYEHCLSIGLWS
jgi:putative PIN family toxin of toxin-antitoxin system